MLSHDAPFTAPVEINVRGYGATGDGVTDDSAAIRLAAAALGAAGGGTLRFPPGSYRIFSNGVTTDLAAFSACNGIHIAASGAELIVDRTFTGSQTIYLFTFLACTNIHFEDVRARCTQSQSAGQHTSRGPVLALFQQGCTNITASDTKVTDFRYCWDFLRASGDPVSYACRGIDLGVTNAYRTGYPLFASLSAYSLKATLITEECGRSYFVSGGYDHEVHVFSKNHQASADCLISTDQGLGMDGVRLTYTNIESTGADDSLNCVLIEFQDSELYVGTHRNIDITLNVVNGDAGKYLGFGVESAKTLSNDTPDPTDRGHIFENITIRGGIIGASSNQRSLNVCGIGTWGSGENVRNIRFKDLRMGTVGQPTINLASLKDIAVLDNVYCSAQMNITGNTTATILHLGVACAGSLTSSNADTALACYVNCNIGSAVNQSTISKQFFASYVGATFYSVLISGNVSQTGATTFSTGTGAVSINGDAAIASGKTLTLDAAMKYNSTTALVSATTADASDTFVLRLAGGGAAATTRGALIDIAGNEHATLPGRLRLFAGDTGFISVQSQMGLVKGFASSVAITATAAGTTTLTGASAVTQTFTGSTTQTVQFPAANLLGAGFGIMFTINNQSSGTVTPTRAGSDTFQGGGTTDPVLAGATTTYVSDGVSVWLKT